MLRTAKLVSTAIVALPLLLGTALAQRGGVGGGGAVDPGVQGGNCGTGEDGRTAIYFFAYGSPMAQLHWYVMATQIRCHAVEMLLTSRDTKLLGHPVLDLNKMKLPAGPGRTDGMGGGPFPTCMKDYARDANLITRVNPVFTEHRVNPVPVRIIIDTKERVKHIHCLSAFPDQARALTDALRQ